MLSVNETFSKFSFSARRVISHCFYHSTYSQIFSLTCDVTLGIERYLINTDMTFQILELGVSVCFNANLESKR